MGLLGGLLGGALGGGLMRGGMMRGGALGGLLANRAMAARRGGNMPSGSGGGTQYRQTEEEQAQQEEEPPKPTPEGQPAPQAAEPRTQVPFVEQQAAAMEKPVEKQAAGPVTSTLMDEEGSVASKPPESPQSSVPPPPAFANQGGGTSPVAEKPSEEFGAQPVPQPQEGDLTDIREQAPRNFVEEQESFPYQPLQFEQASFPMAPVGGSVMPSSSSYAPRFTFSRR